MKIRIKGIMLIFVFGIAILCGGCASSSQSEKQPEETTSVEQSESTSVQEIETLEILTDIDDGEYRGTVYRVSEDGNTLILSLGREFVISTEEFKDLDIGDDVHIEGSDCRLAYGEPLENAIIYSSAIEYSAQGSYYEVFVDSGSEIEGEYMKHFGYDLIFYETDSFAEVEGYICRALYEGFQIYELTLANSIQYSYAIDPDENMPGWNYAMDDVTVTVEDGRITYIY